MVESFDDMQIRDALLRGIYAYGFERPSAIQQRGIMPCVKGRDVIAQAQSGTGKTATYAIAILQRLDLKLNMCQALVMAPTRCPSHPVLSFPLSLFVEFFMPLMFSLFINPLLYL